MADDSLSLHRHRLAHAVALRVPISGVGEQSSLETAVGKGHRRPLWIAVTHSLPGGWQEGADISPLPAKHPWGWQRVHPEKGTRLVPAGH